MKQRIVFAIIATCFVVMACSERQPQPQEESRVISAEKQQPGDSTLYGLACEGCTDSVLVLLPYNGADPDTFDIIEARKAGQVFGRAKTGDQLAVIVNGADSAVADMVINLNRLKGQWAYQVLPHLREVAGMNPNMIPDSIRQRIMQPREYGFKLKHEWAAAPIGVNRKDDAQTGPVEYPVLMWYNEWHIFNGHLILSQDMESLGIKNDTRKTQHDTADIVLLRRDSLVLRFKDHTQGYYRKDK